MRSYEVIVQRSTTAIVGAIAAAALVLSGCSSDNSNTTETTTADHGTHQQHETSAPAADAPPAEHDATHNDADATFARDMVPHHEQAVVMSDIVLAKDDVDPRVRDLATRIKDAQGPEIETMQGWLTEWQVPPADPHAHHGADHADMGMLSDDELNRLRNAQGVDASRQFLEGMIRHHEGAVRMAQTEVDNGKSPEAVALARQIIDSQQREVDEMRQILDSL
ncbi:DUF305 domain-containing protein [Mycolicibacterium vaccae]|uniref:DUF305 domain-containing protein n=1 Tax=Mycolicibacterium vaccae TaxID=1810 RepID=UPI003CEFA83B